MISDVGLVGTVVFVIAINVILFVMSNDAPVTENIAVIGTVTVVGIHVSMITML